MATKNIMIIVENAFIFVIGIKNILGQPQNYKFFWARLWEKTLGLSIFHDTRSFILISYVEWSKCLGGCINIHVKILG